MRELRITNVQYERKEMLQFSGVELNKGRVDSATEVLLIRVNKANAPVQPSVGQHWKVSGVEQVSNIERNGFKYTQIAINADKCHVTLPNTDEAFIRFVAKEADFKGIGEVKARQLWQTFGGNIYAVIENEPDKLSGILSQNSIDSLCTGFTKYALLKYSNWFAQHCVPYTVVQRFFKYYDIDIIDKLKSNPYLLTTFGLSFNVADAIAKSKFNVTDSADCRLIAAVEIALQQWTSKGHTLASHGDLKPLINKLIGNELAKQALQLGHQKSTLFIDDNGDYHPNGLLVMENVIAKRLLKLNTISELTPAHSNAYNDAVSTIPFPLTPKQHEAAISAVEQAVSVIIGGAGTGKTTVLKAVLNTYQKLDYEIHPVALSGRAAKRIFESTGVASKTIARFLGQPPLDNKLKHLLVIDEASMVDVPTLFKIILFIPADTRILLTGDSYQLPPIGPGLVLADIVRSEVITCTELDIVKRQDGSTGIPEYSKAIRNGKVPKKLSDLSITLHEAKPHEVNNKVVELYSQSPSNTMIIAATYNAKYGGINKLNELCQQLVNNDSPRLEFNIIGERQYLDIHLNDPIVFTANNYDLDIQNGTLGKVVSIEQHDEDGTFGEVIIDTGAKIALTLPLLDNIKPAYSISLHKAQGSQFERVVIPITKSRLLDRSWVYTAITRAEKQVELVGSKQDLILAIQMLGAVNTRKTFLHKLLQGMN
jgi:exodeoxyribonuclease V alpha subunit